MMKDMMKLIMKCICVMLPVIILCLYIRGNMLSFAGDPPAYYMWNREFTNTTQEKEYRVIILGDSVANAAYSPEVLSDDTINLSLGASTPIAGYYILQDYLNNNSAPSDVFISFSDNHFQQDDNFWATSMYSHRFSFSQNLEIMRSAVAHKDDSIITDNYKNDFIEYQFYLPNKYVTALVNASFNQRLERNTDIIETASLHMGRYYLIYDNIEYSSTNVVTYDAFIVEEMYYDYYCKIIELCRENHIAVHFIKLPLPDNTNFEDAYIEQIYSYYNELIEKYDNVTFEWFNEPYEKWYFYDRNHMNTHGSLKFSTDLRKSYPDVFNNNEYSDSRIKAINDDITRENKLSELFKWIYDRNYTMLLYDGTGDIMELYPQYLQSNDLELQKLESDALIDSSSLYYINGTGEGADNYTIYEIEDGLGIHMEGQKDTAWHPFAENSVSIVVIDNYNNKIVCIKSASCTTSNHYFSDLK